MIQEPTFTLVIEIKSLNKKAMKERLQSIINEFDSSYGKPCQGTTCYHDNETKVVTPIWDNREY